MKFNCASFAAVSVAFAAVAAPASAGVVFNDLNITADSSNCLFDTACAAIFSQGDVYAAQQFTLGARTAIDAAAFSEMYGGATPVSANYAIYASVGGLPSGAALSSGSGALSATSLPDVNTNKVSLETFDIGPTVLGPGSYFVAVQAVSPNVSNALQPGAGASGAAETHDGGATWSAGYAGDSSISVALYGAVVPEPSTWIMLIAGVGAIGASTRRRRALAL